MKTILAALAAIAFYGCAATEVVDQKPRDPIFAGAEVKVGVKEKCRVEMPPKPTWQVDITPQNQPNVKFENSKAILAELEQRIIYIDALEAAAKKCE